MVESELGCSLDENDIHLLFNGKMLGNLDASIQSCGIQSGSVLEMAISRSQCIKSVLDSMSGKKNDVLELDETSVFLLHLLYLELSCGSECIPADELTQYYVECGYDGDEVREWLSAYRVRETVNEMSFILVSLSVFSGQSSSLHSDRIKLLLSSYPLSPAQTRPRDWRCVISFAELRGFYEQMAGLGVSSLWRIPVQSILNEDAKRKQELWVCGEDVMNRLTVCAIQEVTITFPQYCVLLYLSSVRERALHDV